MHENQDHSNQQMSGEDAPLAQAQVADDEVLYRAVGHGLTRVRWQEGQLKPSTDAFLDRDYQVSVDRAELRGHDPSRTQVAPSDYILRLLAHSIRGIETVVRNDDGDHKTLYFVDVRPDPILSPPNPSHALVYTNPQIFPKKDRKVFSRLKEALAQIATWEPNFAPVEPN